MYCVRILNVAELLTAEETV